MLSDSSLPKFDRCGVRLVGYEHEPKLAMNYPQDMEELEDLRNLNCT